MADDIELPVQQVGPHEMYVYVEKGSDFSGSPRLEAALAELSEALASEETSDVEGFNFTPTMQVGSTLDPAGNVNGFAIGCVRIGCFRGDCTRCNPKNCAPQFTITTSPS